MCECVSKPVGERERTERLRHYNDVARDVMKEELKSLNMEVEERLRAQEGQTDASASAAADLLAAQKAALLQLEAHEHALLRAAPVAARAC